MRNISIDRIEDFGMSNANILMTIEGLLFPACYQPDEYGEVWLNPDAHTWEENEEILILAGVEEGVEEEGVLSFKEICEKSAMLVRAQEMAQAAYDHHLTIIGDR